MALTKYYEFGPFRFDAAAHVLFRGGERMGLSPKSAELLFLLIEAEGNVVSKDKLLTTVWRGSFVEEGSLTSHISLLRKTLGETEHGPVYIETFPNGDTGFSPRCAWWTLSSPSQLFPRGPPLPLLLCVNPPSSGRQFFEKRFGGSQSWEPLRCLC